MPFTSRSKPLKYITFSPSFFELITFFQDICDLSSCIHQYLLQTPCDTSVLSRLRTVTPLPRVSSRTKKHCSFIIYALNNYQKVPN